MNTKTDMAEAGIQQDTAVPTAAGTGLEAAAQWLPQGPLAPYWTPNCVQTFLSLPQ